MDCELESVKNEIEILHACRYFSVFSIVTGKANF